MNKRIFCTLLLVLTLTACAPKAVIPDSKAQALSTQAQLALGTLHLEHTNFALSVEQAKDLLPMWYVLQDLNESDAAAQEEIEGLIDQIQGTMTAGQTKAIQSMNLGQEDLVEAMQTASPSRTSSTSSQSGSTSGAAGGGFAGPPADMAGGLPGAGAPEVAPSTGTTSNSNSGKSAAQSILIKSAPSALLDSVIALLNKKINDWATG